MNHLVEVVVPFFVLGPHTPRRIAGIAIIASQLTLISSGNLVITPIHLASSGNAVGVLPGQKIPARGAEIPYYQPQGNRRR
jgi:hypothetical protein